MPQLDRKVSHSDCTWTLTIFQKILKWSSQNVSFQFARRTCPCAFGLELFMKPKDCTRYWSNRSHVVYWLLARWLFFWTTCVGVDFASIIRCWKCHHLGQPGFLEKMLDTCLRKNRLPSRDCLMFDKTFILFIFTLIIIKICTCQLVNWFQMFGLSFVRKMNSIKTVC